MIVRREHPENSQDALWPVIYDFVYGPDRSAVASVHLQGGGSGWAVRAPNRLGSVLFASYVYVLSRKK